MHEIPNTLSSRLAHSPAADIPRRENPELARPELASALVLNQVNSSGAHTVTYTCMVINYALQNRGKLLIQNLCE